MWNIIINIPMGKWLTSPRLLHTHYQCFTLYSLRHIHFDHSKCHELSLPMCYFFCPFVDEIMINWGIIHSTPYKCLKLMIMNFIFKLKVDTWDIFEVFSVFHLFLWIENKSICFKKKLHHRHSSSTRIQ